MKALFVHYLNDYWTVPGSISSSESKYFTEHSFLVRGLCTSTLLKTSFTRSSSHFINTIDIKLGKTRDEPYQVPVIVNIKLCTAANIFSHLTTWKLELIIDTYQLQDFYEMRTEYEYIKSQNNCVCVFGGVSFRKWSTHNTSQFTRNSHGSHEILKFTLTF